MPKGVVTLAMVASGDTQLRRQGEPPRDTVSRVGKGCVGGENRRRWETPEMVAIKGGGGEGEIEEEAEEEEDKEGTANSVSRNVYRAVIALGREGMIGASHLSEEELPDMPPALLVLVLLLPSVVAPELKKESGYCPPTTPPKPLNTPPAPPVPLPTPLSARTKARVGGGSVGMTTTGEVNKVDFP